MKKSIITLLFAFCCLSMIAQQNNYKEFKKENNEERKKRYKEELNPFKEFGYKPKIATLSKGKYREAFPDSIVQIGSTIYNTNSRKIIGFKQKSSNLSEATLQPDVTSRWFSIDPLADEFPNWSPYNFVENNPLRYIDPTGLAPEDLIFKFENKNSRKELQNTFNRTLGKEAVSIDENGKTTLNINRDDLKTDAQKNLFDVINEASDPKKSDVVINAVSGSEEVLFGNFETNSIDTKDISKLKKAGGDFEKGILGHEIAEQTDKQRNNRSSTKESFDISHGTSGIPTENKILGMSRLPGGGLPDPVGKTLGGRNLITGTGNFRYLTATSTQTLQIQIVRNNVKNVKVIKQ